MRVPKGIVNGVSVDRDRRFNIPDNLGPAAPFRRAKLRVLVMGAAADVGLACAHAFAERDAELFLSDIDGPGLKRTAAALDATGLFCDVSSEASVAIFAREIEKTVPSLDVLVNAAGRSYVRTLGTMRISRALLPLMINEDGPRDIVNIADMKVGVDCGPFPYAASMSAFLCLADAMAETMRFSNVMLTTVLPLSEQTNAPIATDPLLASASWHRRLYCDHRDDAAIARTILASRDRFGADHQGAPLDPLRRDSSSHRS